MSNLAEVILTNATKDTIFEPFKHNIRQRLITSMVLMKKEDLAKSKYLYRKVDELAFWNDISGWFHSNYNYGHTIYDLANNSIEIPNDMNVRSSEYIAVAGDHVIDEDYNIYIIYGWTLDNGSSQIYFDFV